MSENTYLEQYLNQVILPRYLHNWLMEALKKMKGKKNKRLIKKIHKFIDYVDKNEETNLELYQKVILEVTLLNKKNY